MSTFKRRQFLQFAGSTLATLGLSQADFFAQANRYGQVLAQGTPRKLALLIGINNYPALIGPLGGCLTDVELQRQLLIHRFGFNPQDIYELSDNTELKPTRNNILQAFQTIAQLARPNDVVVIHYSGHGSRIQDPNPLNTADCRRTEDCDRNGTIVPIDGLPISKTDTEVVVPDIMGRSLFLMTKAIQTEQLTVVLDSCHSGAGTRGNANVRAARARAQPNQKLLPTPAELESQARRLASLNMTAAEFQTERQRSIARGVVIGSAQRNQLAMDASISDFMAGGFTYLLTRYLWQQTSQTSAKIIYANLQRSTKRLAGQQQDRPITQVPLFEYQPETNQDKPLYFTQLDSPPAEAVITKAGSEIEFWLGGVSSQNLEGTGKGVVFNVLNAQGKVMGEIEQTSRNQLRGYGKFVTGDASAIQEGRLLREKIVGIPTNPILKIGLDPSLTTQLEQARAELNAIKNVEAVNVSPGTAIDYLFGRLTPEYQQELQAAGITNPPPLASLGLFTADRSSLLFDSFGRIDETSTEAINRLQPKFRVLLANQILGQILATGQGSPLRVTATVAPQDNPRNQLQLASRGAAEAGNRVTATPPQFRTGTPLQITVKNQEAQDLYVGIIVVGADGNMSPLYPPNLDDPEESAQLIANEELTIPGERAGYAMQVTGSSGFPEFLILASKEPLRNALKALKSIAQNRGTQKGAPVGTLRGEEPLDVISGILGDLTSLTRSARSDGGVGVFSSESVPYDTATLAVLSGVFEAIPKP